MDIVVNIEEGEYQALVNDHRDFHKQPGYHFHVCQKWPKKTAPSSKMYFQHDNKIMGYCEIFSIQKINNEIQTQLVGQLWRYKNKIIISWLKTNWYEKPIEYNKKIKKWKFKYFDLQKLLGNNKEPALIKMEILCKQKPIDQKEAIKILKK